MTPTARNWIDRCIGSKRIVLFACFLWVLIPVGFVWQGLPIISVHISQSIPLAWEKNLGDYIFKELSFFMARDPSNEPAARQEQLQKRFAQLARLANLSDARLLIRTGPVNALALPGNSMILMDDLIKRLNDDQVMAVVAHELGHLHHRHAMQRMLSTNMIVGLSNTILGGNSQASKVGNLVSSAFINSAYSRDQEKEADTYAIQLLKANDESGLAFVQAMHFFYMHERQHGLASGGWVSSHPGTEERLNRASKTLAPHISVTCQYNLEKQPAFFCD